MPVVLAEGAATAAAGIDTGTLDKLLTAIDHDLANGCGRTGRSRRVDADKPDRGQVQSSRVASARPVAGTPAGGTAGTTPQGSACHCGSPATTSTCGRVPHVVVRHAHST